MRVHTSILALFLSVTVFAQSDTRLLARLESAAPIEARELPQLQGALSSESEAVRLAAFRFWQARRGEALSVVSDDVVAGQGDREVIAAFCKEVVEAIDRAIDHSTGLVRHEAIRTLCSLEDSAVDVCPPYPRICGTGSDLTFGYYAADFVRVRAEARPAEFVKFAEDENPSVVLNALRHLPTRAMKQVQPAIRGMLANKDRLKRAVGLFLLVPNSDQDIFRWVNPLMDDPDEEVRISAAIKFCTSLVDAEKAFLRRMDWGAGVRKALVKIIADEGSPNRTAMLLTSLGDPAGEVRAEAVRCLASILSESRLRSMLDDPDGEVRAEALRELHVRGPADLKALLKSGLTDPSRDVRDVSAYGVGKKLDPDLTAAVLQAIEMGTDNDYRLWDYFRAPQNDPFLDGWLSSQSLNIRRAATASMRSDKDPERFLSRLLKLVNDPDPEILESVIDGLSEQQAPEALEALQAIGRRSEGHPLVAVLRALGRSKDAGSVGFLASYATSSDKWVRDEARSALKRLTDSLIPPEAVSAGNRPFVGNV